MSYQATVYRILVVSPSDVTRERQAIPEVIGIWNDAHSEDHGVVLLAVKWETHSTPAMGDRPQAILNKQIVNLCDILIGAFWTRIVTHTGEAGSGTVEEIEEFRNSGKPILLYFSSAPVMPGSIDPEQYKRLLEFKRAFRLHGLTEDYSSIGELREKLLPHLTRVVKDVHVEPDFVSTRVRETLGEIVYKGSPGERRLEERKIEILRALAQIEAQGRSPVEAAQLSALLDLSVPLVRYHLGELENKEYVSGSYWAPEYSLDHKGREYLVKNRLL